MAIPGKEPSRRWRTSRRVEDHGGLRERRRPPDAQDDRQDGAHVDWWAVIDGEIMECVADHGPMSPQELGRRLGISEGEASAFVSMLVREGKLRIRQVELAPAADRGGPG